MNETVILATYTDFCGGIWTLDRERGTGCVGLNRDGECISEIGDPRLQDAPGWEPSPLAMEVLLEFVVNELARENRQLRSKAHL